MWEDRAKSNVEKANAYDELAAQAEKSAPDAAVGNALEANADSSERNYVKNSATPCNVVEHHASHIPSDLG